MNPQIKPSQENDKLIAEVMKIQIKKVMQEKSTAKILNELGIDIIN